jgi:hypothetical protein
MATVKMKRGTKIADIFDSPETIAQAEKDGFVKVEEKETKETEPLEADSTGSIKETTGRGKKTSR